MAGRLEPSKLQVPTSSLPIKLRAHCESGTPKAFVPFHTPPLGIVFRSLFSCLKSHSWFGSLNSGAPLRSQSVLRQADGSNNNGASKERKVLDTANLGSMSPPAVLATGGRFQAE